LVTRAVATRVKNEEWVDVCVPTAARRVAASPSTTKRTKAPYKYA